MQTPYFTVYMLGHIHGIGQCLSLSIQYGKLPVYCLLCFSRSVQFSSQLSHQLYVGGAGGRDMLIAVMCTFVRKVSKKKDNFIVE